MGNHSNLLIFLYTDPSDLVSADNTLGGSSSRKRSKAVSSKSSSSSKVRKPSNSDSMTDLSGIGGRDSSLFLFRALGKILYCKRESSSCRFKLMMKLSSELQEVLKLFKDSYIIL